MKTLSIVVAFALALSTPLQAQRSERAVADPMKPVALSRVVPTDSAKREDDAYPDGFEMSRAGYVGAAMVLAVTIVDKTGISHLRGPAPQEKVNIPLAATLATGIVLIAYDLGRKVWTENPRRRFGLGQ